MGIAVVVDVDFWGSRWWGLLSWSSPNSDSLLVCGGRHRNGCAGQARCASPDVLAFAAFLLSVNLIPSSLP